MAIAGAPIAGVGAAPGGVVAGAGKVYSVGGAILQFAVEAIAGDTKNAGITLANEAVYTGVGILGGKALKQALPVVAPGLQTELKEATKQTMNVVENTVKSETDKTVKKLKDN